MISSAFSDQKTEDIRLVSATVAVRDMSNASPSIAASKLLNSPVSNIDEITFPVFEHYQQLIHLLSA